MTGKIRRRKVKVPHQDQRPAVKQKFDAALVNYGLWTPKPKEARVKPDSATFVLRSAAPRKSIFQ